MADIAAAARDVRCADMRFELLALALAVACSSPERASPAPERASPSPKRASSPAPSRSLASLSKDEAQSFCERVAAYRRATAALPGAAKIRCGTDALGAAGAPDNTTAEAMRASCRQELEGCLARPPSAPELDCASSAFMDQLAGCGDLTADEMFACTEEMRSMLAAVAPLDPCAMPMDPEDPLTSYNGYIGKLKGPRCAIVDSKCKRTR